MIITLVKAGTTLLLPTQYMEEADRLADDIVVIDHGKGIARGTASQLKDTVGGERIEVVLAEDADLGPPRALLQQLAAGEVIVDEQARRFIVPVTGGSQVLMEALRRLDALGTRVVDIALRRPTLDDVFLALTGHAAEDVAAAAATKKGRR